MKQHVLAAWLVLTLIPQTYGETVQEKATALRKAAVAAKQQQTAVQQKLNGLQGQGKPYQDAIIKARTNVAKGTAALRTAEKDLPAKTDAVKKATAERDARQAALNQATQKKATAEIQQEQTKLAAAQKALDEATAALKKVEGGIAESKGLISQAPAAIKQAETELAKLKPALDVVQQELAKATEETVAKTRSAEEAEFAIGEFVYFSKQVAPIFTKRCLACHNARTAKGRYNMETFTAVMKGGEQGDTILPKEPDTSNLVVMIEDGSMPQDADPLTKDEIAIVKKWVKLGAVLDAGISPDATLTSILPKLPQPPAPEKYRVTVPVTALAYSADGKELASSGYHEILIWSTADGKLLRRISNVAERPQEIQYSPDGKSLAVAAGTPGQYGELKIFDPTTGQLKQDLLSSGDTLFCLAFSPDGKKLATGGADRAIRIFDLSTGKIERVIEDHADWVMGIAWSPDGTKLASASKDKTSKVFEAKTGESLVTFSAHAEPVYGVSFSLDGTQVLTSGRDKQIRIWNVANAQPVRAIAGFGNEVYRLQLTKEGRLFSASADQTAREHKLDGSEVRKFTGHRDWIYTLAVHSASGKIATGSWDGEIRIWNLTDGKQVLQFTAAPGLMTTTQAALPK